MPSRARPTTGAGEHERKRWEDRQVQVMLDHNTQAETERCLRFKGSNQIFPGIVGESSGRFISTKNQLVTYPAPPGSLLKATGLFMIFAFNSIQFVSTEL